MHAHTNMLSRGYNPCFCSDSLGSQPQQREEWKNEICPRPPFNSSTRLQLQDLILISPPEALTGSLRAHSKDSVLALDAGLNQGLDRLLLAAFVCLAWVFMCSGCTLMGSQPYCFAFTPFSAWVTVGSHSQSQSAHSSRTQPISLALAAVLIAQEETWFILPSAFAMPGVRGVRRKTPPDISCRRVRNHFK